MEEKQLNFNRPLLSVRRISSTVKSQKDEKRRTDTPLPNIPLLPSYKPELKSGPLRDPGNVPFVWEHSPGRPKDEISPNINVMEIPPTVPKLPPGRILKPNWEHLDVISEDTNDTKGCGEDQFGSQSIPKMEEKTLKVEIFKETMEEVSVSEDDNEAYMDALDTLSRGESLFYNCSVSGVSELGLDIKPSGTFSTDPKTRDFMMGRFLPAAKAMASEMPQYAPRKQQAVKEQPREVKKILNRDNQRPLRYGPNFVHDYAPDNTEDDSDDDYDQGNTSSKVCGLLPRFCLLNPLPGMSVRTKMPTSPVNHKSVHSSSSGSSSQTEHEPARFAIYEHRSLSKFQSTDHYEDGSVLNTESARNANQKNFQKLEASALYNRLQGHGLSQPLVSKQDEFLITNGDAKDAEVKGFTSQKKGPISFKELLAEDSDERELHSMVPTAEKTLYVDIIHKTESPQLNSYSSDVKQEHDLRENTKTVAKSKMMLGETPYVKFLVNDTDDLHVANDSVKSHSNPQTPIDLGLLAEKPKGDIPMEVQNYFVKDDKSSNDSYTAECTKASGNVNLEHEVPKPLLEESSKFSQRSMPEFPVPPPLPKSPSDSWLWRTLPSVSSKNASLRSYLSTGVHSRHPASKERNDQAKGLLIPILET